MHFLRRWFGHPADDPSSEAPAETQAGAIPYTVVEGEPLFLLVTSRGNEALALILSSPFADHWTPADVFALARFQAWNLAYDAGSDIGRTATRTAAQTAFSAGSPDPQLAARAGLYADLFTDRPARAVFTRDDGFPNVGADTGTRAKLAPAAPGAAIDARALAGAERFFARLDDNLLSRRDPHVGSNSWVVSGDHTASGNPILANDPHLSLIAPPVWWYVHLNTAQAGGDDDLLSGQRSSRF